MSDKRMADLMTQLVEGGLDLNSADGRAGIQALLREIDAVSPGSVEEMAARIQMLKLGASLH